MNQLTVRFAPHGTTGVAVQGLGKTLPLAQLFSAEAPTILHVRLTITTKFLNPKANNVAEAVSWISHLVTGTVTQLPQTNEGQFLSRAKEASEKETEAQEKMVLAGDNCRIRVRQWKKIIALEIWPGVTAQNEDEDIGSKSYGQRYVIGEGSKLFPPNEAKKNPVSGGETSWQFSVVKSLEKLTSAAPMLGLLENLFRDQSLMASKFGQEEYGVAITPIVDDILGTRSR